MPSTCCTNNVKTIIQITLGASLSNEFTAAVILLVKSCRLVVNGRTKTISLIQLHKKSQSVRSDDLGRHKCIVLSLGVLCNLSNVEVKFRSKNFEHYEANAVVLILWKGEIFKIFIDLGIKPLL